MIVLGRPEIGRSGPEFAGHAEVNAEPEISGKMKEHLFAESFRVEQVLADDFCAKLLRVRASKDSLVGVQCGRVDLLVFSGVPLLAVIFDFGQFGHGERVKPAGASTMLD